MSNLSVLLFVESRYKLDRKRVKGTVASVLASNNVVGPVEVSIAFVGSRKMKALSKKFKGDDKDRNILSFPLSEGEPTVLPTDKLRLGDIVISYPYVIKEAAEYEMLVDDRIEELVEHGLSHLLGIHHE
ncbi:MAG TPA: rRNA maturation RNase YbeY [Patescibacteria group bacterium]|nr:rRNA maturation RNase YbeY [Patescibacteria group bacterium]